jgi:hypothetical protein
VDKHSSEVAAAKSKSLYQCPVMDKLTKSRCQYQCSSQINLDKHIETDIHSFQSRNLKDYSIARSALENGVFQFGSRPQRSEAYANMDVTDGLSKVLDEDTHFQPGCYRKPPRKNPEKFKPELRRLLDEMFDEGESTNGSTKKGANKYTPAQALDKLRAMTLQNGLMMFSTNSIHGVLPTERQIKSYWSRRKREKNKQSAVNGGSQQDEEEEGVDNHGNDEIQDIVSHSDSGAEKMSDDPLPLLTNKQTKKSGGSAKITRKRKGQNQAEAIGKKKFVLDGEFEDLDAVTKLIENKLDGQIQGNLSKNVSECCA